MPNIKADVTGKYGETYQQLGRNIQAVNNRSIRPNIGNVLEPLTMAARYYEQKKNEDTPEDRLFKIDMEKEIDKRLATIGSNNRLNPDGFDGLADVEMDKLLEDVPEKHQQWFLEKYKERRNGYYHTINVNAQENAYNKQLEGFMQHSEELRTTAMNFAAQGNQVGYNDALKEWQENEDYMYNHGFMTINNKISRLKDFTDTAIVQQQTGYAKSLFGNAGQLEKQLKNIENSTKYSPEQKRIIKSSILSEYNTWQARNKVANAEIVTSADFGIKALNAGIEPKGYNVQEVITNLTSHGLVDKAKELQRAYDNKNVTVAFAGLNQMQMQDVLRDMKKNASKKEDLDLIKTLENLKDKADKEIVADPLAFALDHNVVEDNGLNFSDPASIAARRQSGNVVKEKYNLSYTPLLTKAETKTLSSTLERADATQKAAIVSALATNFGDDAAGIFADIAPKNPEIAVAGKIYNERPEIAVSIIQGKEIKQAEGGFTPDRNVDLYNSLGGLDEALSNFDIQDVAAIKEAVIAQATYLNKKNNIYKDGNAVSQDKASQDTIDQAISDVLGGKVVKINTRDFFTWGGSYSTVLPENVSKNNFEEWIENLRNDEIGTAYVGDYSVTAADIKDRGQLRYNDNNTYTVFYNGQLVTKANGEPLILRYGGK